MSKYLTTIKGGITLHDVWNALSDPTRRQILDLLAKNDLTAGEIADNFSMTKPSISHHLSILKEAELVFAEKKGQQIYYSVNTTVFEELLKFAANFTGKGGNNK